MLTRATWTVHAHEGNQFYILYMIKACRNSNVYAFIRLHKRNQIRVLPINSVLLLVVADFESVECVDVSDRLQVFDVMFNDMGT